ncbi:unnamed protein product [Urochloa humidicola]
MRIRRRPPGLPLAYLLPPDPPAPQASPGASGDHQERPAGDKKQEAGLHLHPNAAADLGGERSSTVRRPALLPLLPQDSVVERGLGAQQQGPTDGHRSLAQNGHHHHVPEPAIKAAGERLSLSSGGVGSAVAVATTTVVVNATKPREMKDDSAAAAGSGKKPRGPGVLLEGSRCSRKNGRGWRCSQPTMVGYALCQYHLGKGRMRAAAVAAAGRIGVGQLGRTENGKRASAAATAVAAAAPPKAEVPPPSVQ